MIEMIIKTYSRRHVNVYLRELKSHGPKYNKLNGSEDKCLQNEMFQLMHTSSIT